MFITVSLLKETLMNQTADACHPPLVPNFTEKQGQYLAFIHLYTRVNRRPPAEADMQRYFQVAPPTVHQMVLNLEHAGLIKRTPREARSIKILIETEKLPKLL